MLIWSVPLAPPVIVERPYVSCIDGHIVANLSDCPPAPPPGRAAQQQQPPIGGGGGRGLLGLGIGGIL